VLGGGRPMVAALRYGGFTTETSGSLRDAGRRLRRQRFEGIVINAGYDDARSMVADLRMRTDVPIIVVSNSESRVQPIECLNAGADDYMSGSFDAEELVARLRAVMRRTEQIEEVAPIITDDFTIDLADRQILRKDGSEIILSPTEWKVVETLVRRADHLVTREELLASVWGPDAIEKTQYLRVYMAGIRHKLEPSQAEPRYFVTVPGLGLRFVTKRETCHHTTDDPQPKMQAEPSPLMEAHDNAPP
jgi:two-component system, OmpR family, KDP operon response regulator KdpE